MQTQKERKALKDISHIIEPDPVIEVYKKDVDRTLIRENLKLTVEQRLLKLMEMQKFAEELQRAGKEARSSGTEEVEDKR